MLFLFKTLNGLTALVADMPMDRAYLIVVLAALGLAGYALYVVHLTVVKLLPARGKK
ncbi:MAG: hypothetical protein Q7T91_08385 [Sulfuricurvum sp.]|nr:hypothetical protein [Sulfuricurvum sp.]